MFFGIYIFQGSSCLGSRCFSIHVFQGSVCLGSTFFRVQIAQGPDFSASRFRVRVQVSEVAIFSYKACRTLMTYPMKFFYCIDFEIINFKQLSNSRSTYYN